MGDLDCHVQSWEVESVQGVEGRNMGVAVAAAPWLACGPVNVYC